MEKIGLIAGNGKLPLIFADAVREQELRVTAVAHKGQTLPELEAHVEKISWIAVGQMGKLIKILKKEGVKRAFMVGGITKTLLFSKVRPDLRAITLLAKMKHKKDDHLLRSVASAIEEEGIKIENYTSYLGDIIAQKGSLTRRAPGKNELRDIEFGFEIAKEIGRLDIGQSVVVKDQVVLAVEAIEGTDEAIRRGGILGKGKVVVVKVSKPHQDMRFDIPVIGIETVKTLKEAGASVLGIEAGKTLILDKEEVIKASEKENIAIFGV